MSKHSPKATKKNPRTARTTKPVLDHATATPIAARATPWRDAERRLFGTQDVHYELNDASMADLLLASICTHTGEDTVTEALEQLANELSMVTLGIGRAPDTDPFIMCTALSGIERRLRVVKTIAERIRHLADHAEVGS